MSVSTDAGSAGSAGIDIDAVIAGGDSFVQRLAQLAKAKKEHDKALADLNLGKSAIDANNEASRLLASAKEKHDTEMASLEKEVAKVRSEVNAWSEATKADITARLHEAQATLDEAKSMKESADAAQQISKKAMDNAKRQADSLVEDAQRNAKTILDDAKREAEMILEKVKGQQLLVDKALAETAATKAKYEEVARALKGTLA